jgi:hypothetical protein
VSMSLATATFIGAEDIRAFADRGQPETGT